tara:strand:- start:4934 stop:5467 length:534 start_codon:yes stop_codon:yes gene_type:complete
MIKESIFKKIQKVKKEIGAIPKNSKNPFYKDSSYFDINQLIDFVEPVLEKHGLLLLQPIEAIYENNSEWVVTKIICLDTDKSLESRLKLSNETNPQKRGSEITYYRRYTLQSLLALKAEDDDGNKSIPNKIIEKVVLDETHEKWQGAVKFMKNEGDIKVIKKKYTISKRIEDVLSGV